MNKSINTQPDLFHDIMPNPHERETVGAFLDKKPFRFQHMKTKKWVQYTAHYQMGETLTWVDDEYDATIFNKRSDNYFFFCRSQKKLAKKLIQHPVL